MGRLGGSVLLLAAMIAAAGAIDTVAGPQRLSAEPLRDGEWNASVSVSLADKKPISPLLFGIFFEEIGHAGDGGLYAELVQDRSFDALAAATGFLESSERQMRLDCPALLAAHHHPMEPLHAPWRNPSDKVYRSKAEYLQERRADTNYDPRNDIIVAWQPLPGTNADLTRDNPLNEHNRISMVLTAGAPGTPSGIANFGYWGVALQRGESYTVSLYLRTSESSSRNVTISLVSQDLATAYANVSFYGVGGSWRKFTGELTAAATDTNARLAILFDGPGTLQLDMVSLLPTENVRRGEGLLNPWPFRADLLGALKALEPAFMRFPGGCYIEGDWLRNAFRWKDSIGSWAERPGHLNGVWGYWSTDGLGLFEYMLLVEELQTEPIWVINNGVAHGDSVRGADIMPWVEEALDSIEFITGPADSKWGSVRAAMGHPEPWNLTWMAIGNEDCGKPFYLNNYLAFFGAIRAKYPHMRLVANCDMGQDAPTDVWDWHIYTNPTDMFNRRNEFNGRTPENSNYVFASEYAVTDGGGWGNVIGAISEAAFMTGMERNGDIVLLGAYAPLFVHWNNRPWPTNMIVINNHQWFGIPSYHVQQMFRQAQGTHYLATQVVTNPSTQVHEDKVAASATCQNQACDRVALKIVNFSSYRQRIAVTLSGTGSESILSEGELVFLYSDHPEDENSFDEPKKIAPSSAAMDGLSSQFTLKAEPVRTAVAAPQRLPSTNLDVTHAVDATLDVIQSIEQLKSSYNNTPAHHQPASPPAAAHTPAAAEHHSPAVSPDGQRWIGEAQADGTILFRSLDTCCGHMVGEEADGTVTFHFD
ncbi:Alpha-L-arabinofuranosidase 1 isoform B [Chlorella sorokiniana]|uniref:non-reducing end alpha-L-arabinofuranosidase n=1 Tax=Chlorella sorokiniana TaxID=3076 RepID=A0A2P6TX71_CHLSO|nr:Alpha-L-arabinofuranosidase 1 isoform B [Chlorella sorokiniana]|eukprot:PRW58664.1 Alpha-L-arabinofuranosidase 1 isoform B [Chlorella sorokiniana]